MSPIFDYVSWLLPCVQQPFGKVKAPVGMKRAKKKKVPAVEAQPSVTDDTDETGGEVREPPPPPPEASPSPSPGAVRLQQAKDALEECGWAVERMQKHDTIAAQTLAAAEATHTAKMRRIDEAQKRKRRGSAVGQLERIYKSLLELYKAKYVRQAVTEMVLEADRDYHMQESAVLRLENAQLRRALRKMQQQSGGKRGKRVSSRNTSP